MAALQSAVFPKLEEDKILYGEFTKTKLPLNLVPITCTVAKLGDKILVDTILEEEENIETRVSVSASEKGDIHAMQKGGKGSLSIEEIDEMIGLAVKKISELRKVLK